MSTVVFRKDKEEIKRVIMKLDQYAKYIKIKCGCCACDGCGTILGALPPQGVGITSKPTSLAWSASFDIPFINAPPCGGAISGVINVTDTEQTCQLNVGSVYKCYDSEIYCVEESYEGFCYGQYASASLVIGKYKKEIHSITDGSCLGTYDAEVLVPDSKQPCAYWFILSAGEQYGDFGWSTSYNGITGPVPPENIIGSHSIDCTVSAGVLEQDEDGVFQCADISTFQRAATITIS